ncbi:MAG TPA: START-like domain-containing protein [Cytophagaceae bacterium]
MEKEKMTMGKNKFSTEFELNVSPKILYHYINTASGLEDWFADKVIATSEKEYTFIWDGKEHKARKVSQKVNQYVKYEFLPETPEEKKDPSFLEFRIETNELTQTTFLKVTDYSDFDDVKDLEELWKHLFEALVEKVGG